MAKRKKTKVDKIYKELRRLNRVTRQITKEQKRNQDKRILELIQPGAGAVQPGYDTKDPGTDATRM